MRRPGRISNAWRRRTRVLRRSSTSPVAVGGPTVRLNAEVDLIARGLVSRGIEQGERIGIWAPNCPEWTIVQYATAKIGAILVTSNTTLLNNLVACDKQFGLETMCVGGGQGMAMVVERLSRKESQPMTAVERPHPQLSTER